MLYGGAIVCLFDIATWTVSISSLQVVTFAFAKGRYFCFRYFDIVQDTINSDLLYVDKWCLENGMKRNHSNYQSMVKGYRKVNPEFCSENTII